MMKENRLKFGFTIGDTNGIGCELILNAFSDKRLFEFCTPIIFASNKMVALQKKMLGIETSFKMIKSPREALQNQINVINVWQDEVPISFGTPTKESGKCAFESLRDAVESAKQGEINALITAPIDKKNIQNQKFKFTGHTDYLANIFKKQPLMFMVAEGIKLALLTEHIPLSEVVNNLSVEVIQTKIDLLIQSLKLDFTISKPKIAVLAINPHAGDDGVIGHQDDTILKPIIKQSMEEGHYIFGPYPADGFFASDHFKKFDAVLAPYHDQGLIPFKYISEGKGVNFTAGLPIIRVSPAHGTAFDIAGKNNANVGSFRQAIFEAVEIASNRNSL